MHHHELTKEFIKDCVAKSGITLVASGPFIPHCATPPSMSDCGCLAGAVVVVASGHSFEWVKNATKDVQTNISESLAILADVPRDAILAISDGFEIGLKTGEWSEEFRPLFQIARELRGELNPPDYWDLRGERTKK